MSTSCSGSAQWVVNTDKLKQDISDEMSDRLQSSFHHLFEVKPKYWLQRCLYVARLHYSCLFDFLTCLVHYSTCPFNYLTYLDIQWAKV